MARYLSYEAYIARGGTLEEAAFEACALRADARIDALTHGRARSMREIPEAVKAAMMSAVNAAASCGADAMAVSPGLAGFSTDGYSETYQGAGERWESVNRALDREILALLADVCDDSGEPLTYAGVGCL